MVTLSRNPAWTRDELVLALNLYMTNPANPPGKESAAVADISALLNKMRRLTDGPANETFRNPNGVYLKMMNFRALDPTHTAQGKVGMKSGGKLDQIVWDDYAGRLADLAADGYAIRQAVEQADEVNVGELPAIAPYEAQEGGVVLRLHKRYERDRKLVAEKVKAAKAAGPLACEVCSFDFGQAYGELGTDFIEVHHLTPVHAIPPGEKTKLSDLALLCANCHRMAHRRRVPLTVQELRIAMHIVGT
ncbi:HNH endonuclease [Sphingomonas turrisvirgatae]|uniref:HNH endonuclease n=1 Tax=Sphingomonas turrisvirgatae TaxID=1888892 RepID=A0A1E3LXM9_9SPHN|nr:HNH endonuclease [Sphingomonas turrisvirgatae]